MPKFTYKALKSSGETYETVRESADKFALYREVKSEGDTVVSVSENKSGRFSFEKINNILSRVSMHEKLFLPKTWGAMLSAGLSLSRSLAIIEKQTKNKRLKNITVSLASSVSGGKTLSEA